MAIIIWGLAAIMVLLIVAISLPWRLRVQASSAPEAMFLVQGTIAPAPWISFVDSRKPTEEPAGKETKAAHDEAEKAESGKAEPEERKTAEKPKKKRRLPAGIPAAVRDVLAEIRIVRLWANGAFGLGDPADTGMVFGLLTPLIYGTRGKAVRLTVRPDFDRVCAEGDIDAIVQVTPIRLVPPAVRFGWANLRRRLPSRQAQGTNTA